MKQYLSEIVVLTKSYNISDFSDWLKWHLDIIHVDHIHVFDNESSVDIKSICDMYGSKISYELIKGWPNQYALYNNYINNKSQAWWVLPIDDDEFLYIGNKYDNDVNTLLLSLNESTPSMKKLSIGWRNMFPIEFTQSRQYLDNNTNTIKTRSLIDNATAWSNEVCSKLYKLWRQDNRWIKTFVRTVDKWHWGIPHNGGHNPTIGNTFIESILIDGRKTKDDYILPEANTDDLFIAHFQYKSNEEWKSKCSTRISAANKTFNKNKPIVYSELYKYKDKFNIFNGMINLWNG